MSKKFSFDASYLQTKKMHDRMTWFDRKKEILFATAGTTMLALVFIFGFETLNQSSPFALFIIVAAGLLVLLKYKLIGGILLFFCGFALAVHPLLFSSSHWLIPGGFVTGFAGLLILINWWRQTGE